MRLVTIYADIAKRIGLSLYLGIKIQCNWFLFFGKIDTVQGICNEMPHKEECQG